MKEFLRRFFDIKFWKFMGVGIINTLVGMLVMFLMYNVGRCSYWLSSAANYVVGGVVSFFLNKRFTFQNRERSVRVVLRFVASLAVCYLAAYGLARPLMERLLAGTEQRIQENVAMLVGAGLYVGLNYIAQRFFAFRTGKDE